MAIFFFGWRRKTKNLFLNIGSPFPTRLLPFSKLLSLEIITLKGKSETKLEQKTAKTKKLSNFKA